ncbi:MAG: hypothetical protein FJ138_13125 [Deltaproteobacteria bacterium]|nr:hypothetical protein [Deltaproteobacteria bacterium]
MRARVALLRVKDPALPTLEADLTAFTPERAVVTAALLAGEEGAPAVGERVIVEWLDEAPLRARARVEASDSQPLDPARPALGVALRLTLAVSTLEGDGRHYPRLLGGIHLRLARPAPRAQEWVAGACGWEEAGLAPLAPLDALMNFSVHGLAFELAAPAAVSEAFVCEVGLARGGERWRTWAKVARAWQTPAAFGVALQLTSPPLALVGALSAYTLELQRAAL